jgi:hypothetical protein
MRFDFDVFLSISLLSFFVSWHLLFRDQLTDHVVKIRIHSVIRSPS